jgi:ribosomal protein S19
VITVKKIIGFLVCFICAFALSISAFAAACETHYGSNENAHNYTRWANTVKSYLHAGDDGSLMRVQYIVTENKLLAEYYDNSFNKTSQKLVDLEYPIFGGFYAVGDNYFVLTGQSNLSECADVVCFAVTKYDKNWNKIATASLKDCNTVVPFEAGSARFSHSGQYLLIRTCHKMYKSENGYNHQANVTLQLDMNSMKFTDSFTGVMNVDYGYVSHSFNQFIKIDSDKIVALDHGDAYPRSIVLVKYKTSVSTGKFFPMYYNTCNSVDMLTIAGEIGDNDTYCSVGGFEITSSGYLAAINSINQKSSSDSVRNVYLSYCDKNSDSSVLKQITNYTTSGVSTPVLVKINESRFILLWSYDGRVHYCETDDKGNLKSDILSFDGILSDCQPIVYQNKIIWYVWEDNKVEFYSISLGDITVTGCDSAISGHNYQVKNINGTSVSLICSECSDTKSGKTPAAFSLRWEDLSSNSGNKIYFTSAMESSYHPGDTVGLMVKYTEADFNDYEVVSDNESVAAISEKYDEFAVIAKGEGSAKIIVRSKYNHDIKNTYTFKVAHNWSVKENTAASCEKDGKTVKLCSECNETKTDIIAAKGHTMSGYSVIKGATCKATGEKKSTCSVCSFYQIEEIPKKDHDKKVTIEAEAATCTRQGKTEGKKCSGCGTVTVAQKTVDALGHNLGKYEITKAPTCTAQGEETAECTRCSYTKTQKVARVDHKEVAVDAVAPTCTKQGKTEGKKCSVCNATITAQESVEALGHELGEYEITKEPTCSAKGEKTAKCSRCSYTKTADVAKIAHTEVSVEAVAPTCTKQGKTEGEKCSVCNATITAQESVEALGHELGEYEITKEPTCSAKGEKTAKCSRCSYTKTADVAKIAHTEVSIEAVAPTCTKSGKTEGKKCTVCDKVTAGQESIEALGHKKNITVLAVATTEANGKISTVCEVCGEDFGEQRVYRIKSVSLSSTKCVYNGKNKTPTVTVVDYNKDTLIKDRDYTVTYESSRKAIGKYSVAVKFIGKYSGSETLYYEILPGKTSKITATQSTSAIKLKWNSVKGANGYRVYQYDSKTAEYKQIASVKNATEYRVAKLKAGKNYKFAVLAYFKTDSGKVYFSNSKKTVSTATEPAVTSVSLKLSGKTAVVSWNKISGADGYQIYYSTSKNGKYKKLKSTSALSYKKSGLTSGKKYYFKVRAYKKTSAGTVYGEFSKVQSVKIK